MMNDMSWESRSPFINANINSEFWQAIMEPKRSFLSEFPKSTGFVGNLSLMKGWGLRHIINYMICRGGFFAEKNASILGPTVSFPWWSC